MLLGRTRFGYCNYPGKRVKFFTFNDEVRYGKVEMHYMWLCL